MSAGEETPAPLWAEKSAPYVNYRALSLYCILHVIQIAWALASLDGSFQPKVSSCDGTSRKSNSQRADGFRVQGLDTCVSCFVGNLETETDTQERSTCIRLGGLRILSASFQHVRA